MACLGKSLQAYATLSGVLTSNVTSYTFYWNAAKTDSLVNDLTTGTPPRNYASKTYPTAGAYKISVLVKFSNRADLSGELWDTVYNLPLPAFSLTNLDSQCYKGNSYCFINQSAPGAFPSLPLDFMVFNWGDGDSSAVGAGAAKCHTYPKGNTQYLVNGKLTTKEPKDKKEPTH